MCVARTSNNRVISSGDLYCCLLPRCEALHICHSGFPIATKWCCYQEVEVMPSSAFTQKEHAIGVVRCKKEGMLLQPLRWRCVDCVIHHKRDVREEQKYVCVARTSNNRVIFSGDLYSCLLPRCEALRICSSGFPIATV